MTEKCFAPRNDKKVAPRNPTPSVIARLSVRKAVAISSFSRRRPIIASLLRSRRRGNLFFFGDSKRDCFAIARDERKAFSRNGRKLAYLLTKPQNDFIP